MPTSTSNPQSANSLRMAVRLLYDFQRLRIATDSRGTPKGGKKPTPVDLTLADKVFLKSMGGGLHELERWTLAQVETYTTTFPINKWLREQKGIGPAIAGFLLSEFDIHKAPRPSNFWSFAGLHVEDGAAPKPKKGEKLKWNKWLRSKLIFVLGGSFLKADNPEYRPLYDDYVNRKFTQLGPCTLCNGTGQARKPKIDAETGCVDPEAGSNTKCWNCVGDTIKTKTKVNGKVKISRTLSNRFTPDRAPWGKGDAHRHQAAIRYMIKIFLLNFWKQWRLVENLPIVPSYHEAKQGGHQEHESA